MKREKEVHQLKLWQLPKLDHLELIHAKNLIYDYPSHIHEEHCLVLMIRGKETTICRGKSYVAVPKSILLINAEEVHSSSSFETEFKVFKIKQRLLEQIAFDIFERPNDKPYFSEFICQNKEIFTLLLHLFDNLTENNSLLEQESGFIFAMEQLLMQQYKIHPERKAIRKEPQGIRRVKDYLKTNYAENISLSELAAIAGLSRFYLLRVFRRETGVPPHEYQTQVRVTRARKLLRKGFSILETAHETGFFDQSHFSRNFKRITGRTPGKYLAEGNIVQDLS